MADFSITDSLGNPVAPSTASIASTSSLYTYLKSELLHLVVAPDFIARKDQPLGQAITGPTTFKLTAGHDFQLGNTASEVDVTPGTHLELNANTKAGSDLLDGDPFHAPATVPAGAAYLGLAMAGSLDLGWSGTSGYLTFGIDKNSGIALEYFKAFALDGNQPALGAATAEMLANFVIPAQLADLRLLGINDICSVSGHGSLKVSGEVNVATPVNPLASVNLPMGAGTLTVSDGVMAGLTAAVTLTGSYQIRAEKLNGGVIRLSYLKESGSTFTVDLTASAGVSTDIDKTDLLAKLMGAIEKGVPDPKLLDSLTPDEIANFNAAIQAGIDHSVQASLDLALSTAADGQAAFQYEIQLDRLDAQSSQAVDAALRGDLSLLTILEQGAQADGTIAPGVKLLNSVLSASRTNGCSMKVNLLGIVNLISMSQLMDKCEFLFEPASGDLTIKETAQSETISAITRPLDRQGALRSALFYSVMATTAYVAGKAVTMPSLSCQAVHFAVQQNTNRQTIADYTTWFVALNLMKADQRASVVEAFAGGGSSTCTVRAQLDDTLCEALFFDAHGGLRTVSEYQDIGRRALQALLDPGDSDVDGYRYRFLSDPTWAQAVKIGPSPALSSLIPLPSTDPRLNVVLADVTGDLYDIVWWADGMARAGQALQQMRALLAGRDPASLANDPAFAIQRSGLQKLLLGMVASSKLRFHEPWGVVCLFRAAGSRQSSGKLTAQSLTIGR